MAMEKQLETSKLQALGMVETYGLTANIEVANTILKAAGIELVGNEKISASLVTIMVQGDVGTVKTTMEAGAEAVSRVGECVSVYIIPKPHESVGMVLPQARQGGRR